MMGKTMRLFRGSLIFWTLFIGIGAIVGMSMMFIDPTGKMWEMDQLLPKLRALPLPGIFFRDFILSGIVLFLVNGATQLFSAVLLFRNNRHAAVSVLLCGIILMLWCTVEWILFGFNFLSNLYFVFGALEALTACVYWRGTKTEI